MAIKKPKQQISKKPSISFAGYILVAYWSLCAVVHLVTDLFLDLYTNHDYLSVLWCAGIFVLSLAVYTLYIGRETFFTSWYASVFFPLIIYGLYLGSAYFTALKLDLLVSAALKTTDTQVLTVDHVNRVVARKAGFIYTDVSLRFQGKLINFEGTRTSYFLLKPYKKLQVNIGRSYLDNDYVTRIELPNNKRWAARSAYVKDWFSRNWWLLLGLLLWFMFSILKDKYFPPKPVNLKPVKHPYIKKLKKMFIVLISLFGLFMLIVLIVGLLS